MFKKLLTVLISGIGLILVITSGFAIASSSLEKKQKLVDHTLNITNNTRQSTTNTFVIGGFDNVRGGEMSLLSGDYFEEARTSLANNFPEMFLTSFYNLTPESLANIDILLISAGTDNSTSITELNEAEQNELINFVQQGGCAILMADNSAFATANGSLTNPFDIETNGILYGYVTADVTNPVDSLVTNGRFGTISSFTQIVPGGFSNIGTYATSLAGNSLGDALAVIESGIIQPGSGPVIIYSDFNAFTDSENTGAFSENENLFLNTIDFCKKSFIGFTITHPATAMVDSLVNIAINLNNINSNHDVRGVQFTVRVTDTSILSPATYITPTMGGLFPSSSFTYFVPITDGWNFLLTTPLSPTPSVTGTGIVVNLPFVAQNSGCVTLAFTDHKLSNGNAQPIAHLASDASLCVVSGANVEGDLYLDWRNAGHHANTQVMLVGSLATYTTTTNAQGNFTFTKIYPDNYILQANKFLFVEATRTLIITDGITTTIPQFGLWAGDIDQDQDVDTYDRDLLVAAIYEVNHPSFDINDNGTTDIYDVVMLENNYDKLNMTTTNPPPRLGVTPRNSQPKVSTEGQLELVVQNNEMLLQLTQVNQSICAVGVRITLPESADITQVTANTTIANGFLNWYQGEQNLYIVVAPVDGETITQPTDLVTIQGTNLDGASLEAKNLVACTEGQTHSVYLPLIIK